MFSKTKKNADRKPAPQKLSEEELTALAGGACRICIGRGGSV